MKSLVKEHNSNLAKKVKSVLKELGYEIPLGHAYEVISKLSGYPNWDTASAGNLKLNPFGNETYLQIKEDIPPKKVGKVGGHVASVRESLKNHNNDLYSFNGATEEILNEELEIIAQSKRARCGDRGGKISDNPSLLERYKNRHVTDISTGEKEPIDFFVVGSCQDKVSSLKQMEKKVNSKTLEDFICDWRQNGSEVDNLEKEIETDMKNLGIEFKKFEDDSESDEELTDIWNQNIKAPCYFDLKELPLENAPLYSSNKEELSWE